jgi:UDP-N-acetylglucosamine 2-epimerase (non-hydrolysing)
MKINARFGLEPRRYAVATFHRPSNVDEPDALRAVIEIIQHTCARTPMVLPLHPRTKQALQRFEMLGQLQQTRGLHVSEPLGYLEFLSLVSGAALVITDSGGIQEETTYLRVPCITMRENTERPITVDVGSNVLAGTLPDTVKHHIDRVLASGAARGGIPDLWDGRAAKRIVARLREELAA